jgi:hypothetical protein
MKKVKALKNGFSMLTEGKEYEVLGENDRFIVVNDDRNSRTKFPKNIFEEVVEEEKPIKKPKKKKELVIEESIEQEVVEEKEEEVEVFQPKEKWQGGYNENENAEEI